MGARQIFALVLLPLVLTILCVSSGRGQSPASSASGDGTKSATPPLPSEPAGANRCKVCHAAEVDGYARSAMAHSLRRAGQEPNGEVSTPDAKITMSSTAAGYWQRLQTAGDVSNYRIDYVIGSGNHASGYLANIDGHLFQSPIAFYKSRNAYDLAPGYEKTKDPDFTRPVAEGCVFCHAGTELHVAGTDNRYRAPIFPAEAITCERCHGPSEKHLADPRAGTIVNPAKLEAGARDSICEQCHLLGAARVLNPGREFRDFQPGQRLESTFTTYHDALPPNTPAAEFKVISHVEQLATSTCARASQGKLWCGTCHDPHNDPHDKPAESAQYYRSRCLTCHTGEFPKSHPNATSDCIGCHMPRRDAQDGGHTAFTDHRIQRRPQSQSDPPPAGDIAAWREPAPELRKRNLGIAYLNTGFQRRSPDFILRGYRLLTEVQNDFASDPETFTWMGTALLVGKKSSEAELAFERALSLDPNSAIAETNVAQAHQQAGDVEGSIAHLERAVAIDPLHLSATSLLINLYRQEGKTANANELSDRVRVLTEGQAGSREQASGQTKQPEKQKAQTQSSAAPSSPLAERVFKNIQVLKGVPADQIIHTMRLISSSLGVQCGFCHVRDHFEDDAKEPKQVARSMMRMTFAINLNHFDGHREVTCYSCHRGASKPAAIPAVGETQRDTVAAANAARPPGDLPTADQLIDNFVRALGGAEALAKITTRVEIGSTQVDGKLVRVELFTEGSDKQVLIQHMAAGDSVSGVNGDVGWSSVPGHPMREVAGSDLDAARMDADLQFALHIRRNFPELRVEYPEMVDGREAYAVMGIREGQPPWKFFFDVQSGLLVRLERYAETPVGLDPTQIDYKDYRAVDGVQISFARTISRPGSVSTFQMQDIRQNVSIDDSKFLMPSRKTQEDAQPQK